MTIDEMIFGCRQDDPLAQSELYATYSPKMLALCYRYGQSRQDAEDMLQEGFIKVFTQIDSYEAKGSFEGWVRRIMVNTCINVLKKMRKFHDYITLDTVDDLPLREESIASFLQSRQVIECIRSLPIGYRTVLNLYAIEGYSHREIAAMLDIEESTSRSQYCKAKNLLAQVLIQRKIIDKPGREGQLILS